MGVLKGVARVDGKVVFEGTMTFALGAAAARNEPLVRSATSRPSLRATSVRQRRTIHIPHQHDDGAIGDPRAERLAEHERAAARRR